MFADYDEHDALGLAELVKQGQVSAAELLETAIARLEKVNPTLNAVVHTMYAPARAAAERPVAGPFLGVPFLIKDLIQDIAGQPTVGRHHCLAGWKSHWVVARGGGYITTILIHPCGTLPTP